MNLLLFADNIVGTQVFEFLLNNFPDDLKMVVTTENNTIYQHAGEAGVEAQIFRDSHSLYERISHRPDAYDLGILAWWPKIIKRPLLDLPTHGLINFHPSLLPHNRGKHYNFWAIVEEAPFGVTLHFIDEGVDTGEIIAQRPIIYDWTDTGESLYLKAQEEIVQLFIEQYPRIRALSVSGTPQNLSEGSFHKASELEDASRINLDDQYRGRDILNLLRARTFKGHPACWFEDDGDLFEVRIDIKRKR